MRERERGEIRMRVRGGSVGRSSVLDLRLGRAQVVLSAKLCNTRVAGLDLILRSNYSQRLIILKVARFPAIFEHSAETTAPHRGLPNAAVNLPAPNQSGQSLLLPQVSLVPQSEGGKETSWGHSEDTVTF